MSRNEVLDAAHNAVYASGGRAESYGHPADNFRRTARLWNTYMEGRTYFQPHDVAMLMILNKVARLMATEDHIDSIVDIAGYAEAYAIAIANQPLRASPPDPPVAPE